MCFRCLNCAVCIGGLSLNCGLFNELCLQAKLVDKRQVQFGIALGALVALLVSAVAASIFPSAYAPWIGGISVVVWMVVSIGVIANQYGNTRLELQAASHLSRLGMLAPSVLLGIYTYWAFFPSYSNVVFWVFVMIAVVLHGGMWIAVSSPNICSTWLKSAVLLELISIQYLKSCIRHDDNNFVADC